MSLSVVLPGEGDVAVLDGKNAVIGEGDAVGVSGEVAQDLFGPAEGGLGVDDPFAAAGVIEQSGEGGRICQVSQRAVEGEFAVLEGDSEVVQEDSAKEAREHAHGQEEVLFAGDPALAISRQAAGGDDAVKMGMVEQVLSPGVQDGEEADCRVQMLGVSGDGQKSPRGGAEEDLVEGPLVLQGDGSQKLVGDGEDHVEVGNRQQLGLTRGEPVGAAASPALGAVAITARVVGDRLVTAVVTY